MPYLKPTYYRGYKIGIWRLSPNDYHYRITNIKTKESGRLGPIESWNVKNKKDAVKYVKRIIDSFFITKPWW